MITFKSTTAVLGTVLWGVAIVSVVSNPVNLTILALWAGTHAVAHVIDRIVNGKNKESTEK
jgi:hypothetical protein